MEPLKVRYGEWDKIIDAAKEHSGIDNLPLWNAVVNYYNICVPSLVTDLSSTLWNLHQRIRGTKNETYSSFYELPAFWVSACTVIDNEINRIDKVRSDKSSREQRETLRSLKGKNKYGNK